MHIEEAEDLGLREAERVQDGAGLQRCVSRQVHYEFHAYRPIPRMMAFGQTELRVKLLANGTDGAVSDDRERRVDVHARHEAKKKKKKKKKKNTKKTNTTKKQKKKPTKTQQKNQQKHTPTTPNKSPPIPLLIFFFSF